MTKRFLTYLFLALVIVVIASCKKESAADSNNPYDSWSTSTRGSVMPDLAIDPNTIQGLHKNIFKPTCANSGCHDGNFEPDFRSIESSYNSLINRTITNPDPNRTDIIKRVNPSDAATSMILHRINTFIPGTQGQMPLTTDPGSDWPSKKLQYIQNITQWIKDGAKDQFGKSALNNDFKPQLGGLIVFANGSSTPLQHINNTPVDIPAGTSSIKIMVAFTDDKTAVNSFGTTTLNYSLNPNSYLNTELSMTTESSAFNGKGVLGTTVDYWHSLTVQLSTMGAITGDVIWLRTNTTDNVNPAIYIPESTTSFNIKKYFAIRIK
ncbi:MAG: hypothetical protein ACKVQB_02995 [Bacteroidia bacterium]